MVWHREAHCGGGLRNGGLAQYRIARRAVAMGVDSRSARRVCSPGLAMHRSRCRTGADHLLVRQALANGEHFPGSTSTPWLRNPATLVGAGDSEDCSSAVGTLLAGHTLGTPTDGVGGRNRPQGSVVRQAVSDLLRRFSAGAQGVVGAGSDFLRVARRDRHGKSPTRVCGAANRRGLLCSVMAKVELRCLLGYSNGFARALRRSFAADVYGRTPLG